MPTNDPKPATDAEVDRVRRRTTPPRYQAWEQAAYVSDWQGEGFVPMSVHEAKSLLARIDAERERADQAEALLRQITTGSPMIYHTRDCRGNTGGGCDCGTIAWARKVEAFIEGTEQ